VLPIHREGEVIAVLDIDSPVLNRFGEEDRVGLTALVKSLEKHV
jgi:GAF domain-containing protein